MARGGSIRESNKDATETPLPAAAAGICISPVAFVVVEDETVRLMPVESNHAMERVSEAIPQLIGLIKHFGCKGKGQKQGQTKEECCTETVEQKPCGDEGHYLQTDGFRNKNRIGMICRTQQRGAVQKASLLFFAPIYCLARKKHAYTGNISKGNKEECIGG